MKNLKLTFFIAALVLLGAFVAFFATRSERHADVPGDPAPTVPAPIKEAAPIASAGEDASGASSGGAADDVTTADEGSEPETAEDKAAAEEERRVDSFDAETDKWMDVENAKAPTMQDIYGYAEKFNALPEARKEECLQRALNLIPDENVMLLVGILMDKSQKKDFIELIYNDVLNRSEDVKKPILKQIYSDRSHPCWADTAWILDVTGEKKPD